MTGLQHFDGVATTGLARSFKPYVRVAATALILAVVTLMVSPPSANAATATVGSRKCEVFADNPHPTTTQSGATVVNAKARIGKCNGSVINIHFKLTLQRCYQASFGCIWSTHAIREDDILGTNDNLYFSPHMVRQVSSSSCVNKKWRLIAKITMYTAIGNDDASSTNEADIYTCP